MKAEMIPPVDTKKKMITSDMEVKGGAQTKRSAKQNKKMDLYKALDKLGL